MLLLFVREQRPVFGHIHLLPLLLYPLLHFVLPLLLSALLLSRCHGLLLLQLGLLLLPLSSFLVILLQADMPRQAAHSRNRLELVDHVAGDEVDVVMAEPDAGVADTLPPELV